MSLQDIQNQCHDDSVKWFPVTAYDIPYMTLCMTGEVGEFANKVKKIIRRGELLTSDSLHREDLCEELTDVFIYLMNIAELLGMDMEWWYAHKREKNAQRFANNNEFVKVKDNPQA